MGKQARRFFVDLPDAVALVDTDLFVVERKGIKHYIAKTELGGGASWVFKSDAYTMSPGEAVLCSSNGAGTGYSITAPATIAAGDPLEVANDDEADLVTFARNGHTLKLAGVTVTEDVDLKPGESLRMVCKDSSTIIILNRKFS